MGRELDRLLKGVSDEVAALNRDVLPRPVGGYSVGTTAKRNKFGNVLCEVDGMKFDKGSISDGYHTFDELYEHRAALFIALGWAYVSRAWKTWRNQEGEAWEGWFIAGIDTPMGQISYHLPGVLWQAYPGREVEYNADYDGHTAADVLIRLTSLAGGDE
jgi:hypothetical protein